MQEFFTNTLESKYIKYLLSKQLLPLYHTVDYGSRLCVNHTYLFEDKLIKCLKTGVLYPQSYFEGYNIIGNNINSVQDACEYKVLYKYMEDIYQPSINNTYKSKYGYYDPETHVRLGNYLRYLRDIKHIDLMPLYNCFNYTLVNNIELKYNGTNNVNYTETSVTDYKVLLIPIKFNTPYTIAINSEMGYTYTPIFYNKTPNDSLNFGFETINKINYSNFNNPMVIEIDNNFETDLDIKRYDNEKYLKLAK